MSGTTVGGLVGAGPVAPGGRGAAVGEGDVAEAQAVGAAHLVGHGLRVVGPVGVDGPHVGPVVEKHPCVALGPAGEAVRACGVGHVVPVVVDGVGNRRGERLILCVGRGGARRCLRQRREAR